MKYDIEIIQLIFDTMEERISKATGNYVSELQTIRAGRANPHILDRVLVDYYGAPTPIGQMATITVPEARVLVISVWDKSALKSVEKAILAANVGINPNNDGIVIRLIFPEITEERRKGLVKDVKTSAESVKVVLRNSRRDAIDELKKLEKSSDITEDDLKEYTKDVDKVLQESIDKVDKIAKDKEQDIMSV